MDTDLSARITLMSQYRKIDVKIVFHYPRGPLPRSILDAFEIQRKTNKTKIMHKVEPEMGPSELYPSGGTTVLDGMAVLQEMQLSSRALFRDVSNESLKNFLNSKNRDIHVVLDVYRNVSIKNMKRSRRGLNAVDGVQYKSIFS